MNILILGSGGREHTFAWKIKQSPLCKNLYVAPGNAGTASLAQNISLNVNDFEGIKDFCVNKQIDLLVVGPEDPLVNGIRDYFINDEKISRILIIGPDKSGARLEGSKDFSKKFMSKYNIPTAKSCTVTLSEINDGFSFLESQNAPFVLKADGLAAGKGVIITPDLETAKSSLQKMLEGQFGMASKRVVIEEYLSGIELSVFVLTDGKSYKILPEAKDYKRIGEGDTGPNTGGMGAVSPVPFADTTFMEKVERDIVIPTIQGIKNEGMNYKGFVFIGIMNVNGMPFVIEYNVRMGDPETQVVFPRINTDLVEIFKATAQEKLHEIEFNISDQTATTVVAVADGYPNSYQKGKEISGLEEDNGSIIFHAGTKKENNTVITNGGRVLAVTGLSNNMNQSLKNSYNKLNSINWEGMNYRKDIGDDLRNYKSK
jgi:phosphoribosylamine--glycine ligase